MSDEVFGPDDNYEGRWYPREDDAGQWVVMDEVTHQKVAGPFATEEEATRWTWSCADCGIDTVAAGEQYAIDDQLWGQAISLSPRRSPMVELCVGCVEKRIGRALTAADFKDAPINRPHAGNSNRLARALSTEG
jgi:hypothetical protein